jgi:hypothetical protein
MPNSRKHERRTRSRGRAMADGLGGPEHLRTGKSHDIDQTAARAPADRDDGHGRDQAAERAYESALAKRAGGQL